jgi:hypothetical protein
LTSLSPRGGEFEERPRPCPELRKIANAVFGTAYGIPSGIVVDACVELSERLQAAKVRKITHGRTAIY